MKKLMRIVLGVVIAAGVVSLCFFLAINFILTKVTKDEIKAFIQNEVRVATGYGLSLQGEIDFSIGLFPSIFFKDVLLTSPNPLSSGSLASVKELEVGISIPDLIMGGLRIQGLNLKNADVILETDTSGRDLWLINEGETQDDAASSGSVSNESQIRTALGSLLSLTRHFNIVVVDGLRVVRSNRLRGVERVFEFSDVELDATDEGDLLSLYIRGREDESVINIKGVISHSAAFLAGEAPLGLDLHFDASKWSIDMFGSVIPGVKAPRLDIRVSGEGPALRQVITDLDELFSLPSLPRLPERLAFKVEAKLTGSTEEPVLDGVDINLMGTKQSNFHFDGRVLDLNSKPKLEGAVVARLEDFAEYGTLVAPQAIDWSHPFLIQQGAATFSGKLLGNADRLSVLSAQLEWGRKNSLRVSFTGDVGNVFAMENLDARVNIHGKDKPDIRSLAISSGVPSALLDWPNLGEFTLSAKALSDASGRLTLSDIRFALEEQDSVAIELEGDIHDPWKIRALAFSAKISGNDSPLLRKIVEEAVPILPTETLARIGRFHAKVNVVWNDAGLSMRDGNCEFPDFHNTKLSFDGEWKNPEDFQFDVRLDSAGEDTEKLIRDTTLVLGWGELYRRSQAVSASASPLPFDVSALFSISANHLNVSNLNLSFGKTKLFGDFNLSGLPNDIAVVAHIKDARINAPQVLHVLGGEETKKDSPSDIKVFSKSSVREFFQGWRGEVIANGSVYDEEDLPIVENIDIDVQLVEGTLSLNTVNAKSGNSGMDIKGSWQLAPGAKGRMTLDGHIDRLEFGRVLSQYGIADWLTGAPLSGKLRGVSSGLSPHELASNFTGRVELSVGPGVINNDKADWLAGDLVSNIYNNLNPFSKKIVQSELECAAVAVDFDNGVASFKNGIGFETKRIAILGTGIIDLGREEVDVALASTPKDGLGLTISGSGTVARLKGALSDPALSIDEWAVAKRGFSVGAAYLTGGLSLIFETLTNRVSANTNSCKAVLGAP